MHVDLKEFLARTGAARGVVCIAPHPDDESAGAGGLLALCADAGIQTSVVVVTDGGASHPGSVAWPRERLAALRRSETIKAIEALGMSGMPLFLNLPDAATPTVSRGADEAALAMLTSHLDVHRPGLVLTTWRREPHCDHRYAYDLARRAMARRDARLIEYLVWTPLRGNAADLPTQEEALRLDLDIFAVRARKRAALACHESQRGLVVRDDPDGFVLDDWAFDAMTGPVESYLL